MFVKMIYRFTINNWKKVRGLARKYKIMPQQFSYEQMTRAFAEIYETARWF